MAAWARFTAAQEPRARGSSTASSCRSSAGHPSCHAAVEKGRMRAAVTRRRRWQRPAGREPCASIDSLATQADASHATRPARWSVKFMDPEVEMRSVSALQASAFYTAQYLPAVDTFLMGLFRNEIMEALRNKCRYCRPTEYACLVANEGTAPAPTSPAPAGQTAFTPGTSLAAWAAAQRAASGAPPVPPTIVGVVEVALTEDPEVGAALGTLSFAYLSCMAVSAGHRRRGCAQALLARAEALASAWGMRFTTLHVYSANAGARAAYLRAGYEILAEDPVWRAWIPGQKRRQLMFKELPAALA